MGAIDGILARFHLARMSELVISKVEIAELTQRLELAEFNYTEAIRKIALKAAGNSSKVKTSGAQLRRLNETYNARASRESEPKSVSEILKEQANG